MQISIGVKMNLKVKIKSTLYEEEFIGVNFSESKGLCEIGGKDKMQYECESLINKKFSKLTIIKKKYKNNITRLCFYTSQELFMEWIDTLKGEAIGLKFVNSLERIMR